ADARDGASEFAFREKRQQRRELWAARGRWFRSAVGLRLFGQWFIHCVLELACGYFESYVLPLVWSVTIIVCCGFLYAVGQGIEPSAGAQDPPASSRIKLNDAVYFSAVTFTTLGYGDYRPRPGPWRLVAGAEAFAGAFLISVFVVTLAHRYVVR
ncbi:MAG: potassium channel family protein, partial [Planctomycetota bacterium]